jgi:CRP-like cAMP-binding protein
MYQHPLFEKLNEDEYNQFLKIFEEKTIQKGETIIKDGESGDTAFLLIEGQVSVIKETIYGEDYVVTTIDAGGDEFFGEINLIDKGIRTSTITAITDVIIWEVSHNEIFQFMDKNPVIGYKIMSYLAKSFSNHLRKADNDLITLFNALVEVVEND